ncbi:MAG: hypothetical protein AAFN13_07720 [Bacteroidota bacterium]
MLFRALFAVALVTATGCWGNRPAADDLEAPIETSTLERIEIAESDYGYSGRGQERWEQLATLLNVEVDVEAEVLREIRLLRNNGQRNLAQLREHRRRLDQHVTDLLASWDARLEQYADSALREQSAALRKDVEAAYASHSPRLDTAFENAGDALAALDDRQRLALDLLIVQVVAGVEAYADTYEASAEERTARMQAQIAEADSLLRTLRD